MFAKSLRISFVGLIAFAASAWAVPSTLEGTVKDPNGQPLKGADVRIEAKGGSNFSKTVKTDVKGQYVCSGMAAGVYRVTLLVNGATKASINNARITIGEPAQLNFNLKKETGQMAKKKATHMVYVPAETGTHLGGRWVEVNDNDVNANIAGPTANTAGADNVKKTSGEALGAMQHSGGH